MNLHGTLSVASYSLLVGAFRWVNEDLLTQSWWSLTGIRIGVCLVLERLAYAYPLVRLVITGLGVLDTYRHNVRGRLPTDHRTTGLALVTGATAGIGLQTCVLLCERGVDVIVPARTLEGAQRAARCINEKAHNAAGRARPAPAPLELASVASVRAFCDSIKEEPITLVVLNAGVMLSAYSETEDGAEGMVASNHLGHFQLARALAPRLQDEAKSAKDVRVVVVSSSLHRTAARRPDIAERLLDFRGDPATHTFFGSYAVTKLQNMLFAVSFAQRYPSIACVACHPGFVKTSVTRHLPLVVRIADTISVYMWLLRKTARQGAHSSLHCCLSPQFSAVELRGESRFVADCSVEPCSWPPHHHELAEALWRRSEAHVDNVGK